MNIKSNEGTLSQSPKPVHFCALLLDLLYNARLRLMRCLQLYGELEQLLFPLSSPFLVPDSDNGWFST